MHQCRRYQDQRIFNAAGQQQAVEDQQRFDGLTQSDLVGEQDANPVAFADIASDRQLVIEEADTATDKTARRRGQHPVADDEGVVAQVEEAKVIDLATAHAVLGGENIQFGIQVGLTDFPTFAAVNQQCIDFDGLFDAKADAVPAACLLAFAQARSSQRGIPGGVAAHDVARGKGDNDLTTFDGFDEAEAQFGFGQAVPALAACKIQWRLLK